MSQITLETTGLDGLVDLADAHADGRDADVDGLVVDADGRDGGGCAT